MQTVVAGLIWSGGKLLIAQRHASGAHPLEWEFPGGKVEPGESAEQAVIRELREELEIVVELGPEVARYEYAYSGKQPILLIFIQVASYTGAVNHNGLFQSLTWAAPRELSSYNFLKGDLPLIQLLREIHVDQV